MHRRKFVINFGSEGLDAKASSTQHHFWKSIGSVVVIKFRQRFPKVMIPISLLGMFGFLKLISRV